MSTNIPQDWREYLDALMAGGGPLGLLLAAILAKMDNPANPMTDDMLDRAARQLGIISGDVNVTDRAARLLGIMYGNVGQVQQRAVSGDLLVQLQNAGVEIDPRDVSDRAARLLGIVYGALAQLQQKAGTFELLTEDTGVHTNPEQWLQDNHWNPAQITLNAAAAVNLGAAVAVGKVRRVKEITARNVSQANTVITLSVGGVAQISFDVPAQTTRTWSSEDGRSFAATTQPQIASSAAAGGGETYISASGVEK